MRIRLRFCLFLTLLTAAVLARPAAASSTLTDQGDGTVLDSATGLHWQREDDNVSRRWRDALAYCEGLTLGGRTDWRLPGIKELRSLVADDRQSPAIDEAAFPGTNVVGYWSSTTRHGSPNFAWYILFSSGYVYTNPKTEAALVRCVR